MKTNELMDVHLATCRVAHAAKTTAPARALLELSSAPIVDTEAGVVLEPLRVGSVAPHDYPDRTGFEAATNKIHVEDYVDESSPSFADLLTQGFLYAERLAQRLGALPGAFRVLMTADEEMLAVTVRFHRVRAGEPWGYDDPSQSTEESVAIWDVGAGGA